MAERRLPIRVDAYGNIAARFQQWGQDLQRFSTRGQRAIGALNSAGVAIGNGLERLGNRYTALLTGAAGAGSTRYVLSLERRLTRLGINAGKTQGEMAKLRQEIVGQALELNVDPDDLLAAAEEIVAKTGDLDLFRENLANIATTMQATGAAGDAVGVMVADLDQKFRLNGKDEFLAVLDEMARQGKAGSFELRDMVSEGAQLSAIYASTGRSGRGAAREMGAILQVIRQSVGTAAEATTAFERLITTITREKASELARAGIQIWDPDELKNGRKIARAIPEIIKEVVTKANGDMERLGKIFNETRAQTALLGFVNEFNATGRFDSLDSFLAVQGDGTVLLEDAGRAARDAAAAYDRVKAALKGLADDSLAAPLERVADAINSIDADNLREGLRTARNIALALGGAVIGSKLLRAGSALARRGAGAGAAGAALGAAAGAVQPVFVTNWPGVPGMAGAGAAGAAATGGTLARAAGTALRAGGAVAVAGSLGYAAGTLVDHQLKQSNEGLSFRDRVGEVVAATLAALGNSNAREAMDRDLNARAGNVSGTISVKIDSEGRPRVTSVRSENPGVDLEADVGMVMSPAG
ncbi:MAG: hypothetical protein AB7Q81_24395 [Gammaproteobacteria bacterium]